jgi:prepilin-type N-terminal cleavage/methylation domain-containing protein
MGGFACDGQYADWEALMQTTRAGFTLIEVLMTVFIMTLVGGAILILAFAGRRVSDLTNARLTAMTGAERAMSQLTAQLRQTADTAVGPATCLPTFSGHGALRFTPTNGLPPVTYGFDAPSGQLFRRQGGTPQRVIASGLQDFRVSCQGTSSTMTVNLQVIVQATSWQQMPMTQTPMTQTLESQVWVRNPSS